MSTEPTTIGRYRVLGELGQGAMGIVYLAEDPVLKRGVAIKVMKPGAMSPEEALRRFHREAEVSAKLNHPNVITIFDVGNEPGLGPFLAMEHLQGTSLSQWLQGTPRDAASILRLLIQAMHGLEAAHAEGITHRDIKPDNLMVTHSGRLKLMDFGIARAEDAVYVTANSLLCTPGYAAPEILDGKPSSPVTDRWTFVVTTFQCLTGSLPWEAETLSGVLFKVAHMPPTFPEDMDPRVRAVFDRALAKDPQARHPSLQDFLRDLVEVLPLGAEHRAQLQALVGAAEDPVSLTAPVASQAAPEVQESHPRHRVLYAVLGVLLLVAVGQWIWMSGLFRGRALTLHSRPEGAKVFLDGAFLGTTPLEDIRVPSKARALKLEKDGFLPYEHALEPGQSRLRFLLAPEPKRVPVRSEPPGAEVFLDGELKGITPMERLAVPALGSYTLFVRKKGFESWGLTLEAGHPPPDPIRLEPSREARPQPSTSGARGAAASPEPASPRALAESTEDPNVPATSRTAEKPGKVRGFFRRLFGKDRTPDRGRNAPQRP